MREEYSSRKTITLFYLPSMEASFVLLFVRILSTMLAAEIAEIARTLREAALLVSLDEVSEYAHQVFV